jgi:hypothetical protein
MKMVLALIPPLPWWGERHDKVRNIFRKILLNLPALPCIMYRLADGIEYAAYVELLRFYDLTKALDHEYRQTDFNSLLILQPHQIN